MVHNNVSLTVSQDEAARADDEAKRRLLRLEKLSLVVDLDQTIIHATVDPTVADWQSDKNNPNHDAVKDVRSFLLDDDARDRPGCVYYIKLRPYLKEFLENVSKMYELHIYTMGTRAYAKNIAKIIDPDQKIFGDRILSRTESGSMTAKSLQRLFPVDTKMVVIIDDRGDVWKWSPNLIKVTPYDFFVGIGDINSSFLPKKPGPRPSPKAAAIVPPKPSDGSAEAPLEGEAGSQTNGSADQQAEAPTPEGSESPIVSNASPLEQLVAMGESDDLNTREAQTSSQKETVDKQVEERPLLQKQKQLEAEDAATESTAATVDGSPINSSHPNDESNESDKPKHNLLQDDDRELVQLEEALRSVRTEFYKQYNQSLAAASGGRLAQLCGGQKRKSPSETLDLDLVPDIKEVLPSVKSKVLDGVIIVFSGVVPLGMDVQTTDIAILAKSFGARIHEDISRHTTHLVAARNRTTKVTSAKKRRIAIVSPQWLTDSVASWAKKEKAHYRLDGEDDYKSGPNDDEDILSESDNSAADNEDDETDDVNGRDTPQPGLKIDTNPPSSDVGDSETDIDYDAIDQSPVGGTNDDWDDMSKEINEFLGSDDDDGSDMDPFEDNDADRNSIASDESVASSKISVRGKKRGREESESGSESVEGKAKRKKKQTSSNGLTSLSQTTNADASEDEGTIEGADEVEPQPHEVNGEVRNGKAERIGEDDEGDEEEKREQEDDDDDDGWGDEMAKEFEEEMRKAQQSEEQGEG